MSPPPKIADTLEMHAADVARFTERMEGLRRDFIVHDEKDTQAQAEIFTRLGKIERLLYIGMGGVIVLGAIMKLTPH